jgi:ABC-type transport system involved in cytochrome c biogenesis permease subunit
MKFKNLLFGFLLTLLIYLLASLNEKTLFPENSLLFGLTTFIYLGAGLLYLIFWIFKWERGAFLGSAIGWAGFFLNLLAFFVRWVQTHQAGFGYVPLSNLYESLVFFSLCTAGIYLFLEPKLPTKIFWRVSLFISQFYISLCIFKNKLLY